VKLSLSKIFLTPFLNVISSSTFSWILSKFR
jgi:hypothetical protein